MADPPADTSEPDPKAADPPLPGVSKEKVLWHLGPPPYPETSLEDLFVNGSSIDDDVTIPWVRCGTCKDGVYCFGNPRVLPYECVDDSPAYKCPSIFKNRFQGANLRSVFVEESPLYFSLHGHELSLVGAKRVNEPLWDPLYKSFCEVLA